MVATVLVTLIALLHVYILVLEMFLWETPKAMKVFRTTPESAASSKVLAANQGLYNGFLAAGLLWALVLGLTGAGKPVATFFLVCIAVAGLYGAATANKRILFVQTVPALLTLGALYLI